ncbi:MAG: protein-export chaperone SecB [Zoogloeaceae bacterium]|jgi:preprotein translocase subunit SecB|nr:protein-export chaperone SecB [Zoogloeaceae bacterium]
MEPNQTANNPAPAAAQDPQPSFGIEKLYVKDLSVEVPNAPNIFLEQGAPQIDIQLTTQATPLGEGVFNVVLTVTVTAKRDEKTVFLVEVGQAGIFRIAHVPEQEIEPLLAVACPNILQSYAREVISSASTQAGFPPVLLQPINFEALYFSRLQEQRAAATPAEAGAGTATVQ